jgi:hypothetical protein
MMADMVGEGVAESQRGCAKVGESLGCSRWIVRTGLSTNERVWIHSPLPGLDLPVGRMLRSVT